MKVKANFKKRKFPNLRYCQCCTYFSERKDDKNKEEMKNKEQEMSESGFCGKIGAGGDSDIKRGNIFLAKRKFLVNPWGMTSAQHPQV